MSFAAPLFLLGLFALIIPWVLHRLNQHDAPVQDFPSNQFLQPTTAVSSRKKQLRYLKLLALRLLLIALLCLLFAQPAIKRLAGVFGETENLHVIVLDKSFSMQREGSWTAANDHVNEILDTLASGSSVQLMSAGAALTEETDVTLDQEVIVAAMISVKPTYERLRYGELMRQLSAHAAESELPVVVHIVSDMQASAMPARANELLNREFAALELYDVRTNDKSAASSNAAIRAKVKARDQDTFDLVADISRFGAIDEQTLSLYKSDELVSSTTVSAGADDTFVHSFEAIAWPPTQAVDQYELRLTPLDSLPADDIDVVAVRREPALPIAIASNASAQQRRNSVDELYLKTALSLDPRNEVSAYAADALNLSADVKILIYLDHLNVESIDLPALPAQLQRLLEEGVHILYVLNAATPRLATPVEIVSAKSSHPLELNLGDWEDVRFFAQQSYQTDAKQTVLMDAGADYPVLIEQLRADNSATQGKLLWLNAALNGADNSLPVSPVFVPFLSDVVDYFARAEAYPDRLTVGDGIRLEKSVQLVDPAGNPMLGLADQGKGKTQLLSEPGIYTLLEADASFAIKVEADIVESDVRAADAADIERWQFSASSGDANSTATSSTSTEATTTASVPALIEDDRSAFYSLTRWLLPVCLLLVLLETLYANWHLRARRI